MKKSLFSLKIIILLYILIVSSLLTGQNSNDPDEVTTTYFIRNANVVQKPGTLLEGTSVLIKDGMIQSVGKSLIPPYDAWVIDADSMYVYAGFIDAASHTAIPKKNDSKEGGRNKVENPGNPTNEEAGITPEKKAKDIIKADDKSIAEMRKYGFTISHVVPEGRMLPGKGAILSLGEGPIDHLIIDEESALFAQWKTSRGSYPATIIGMIAKWRDLINNAKILDTYTKKYNTNPAGMPRPVADEATHSIIPVVYKHLPVYFKTEKVLEIHRAISLSEELGFDIVLTEVKQIDPVIDLIQRKRIPILLSIDLPKEMKDEKESAKADKAKVENEKAADQDKKEKEDKKVKDPEKKALQARKKKAYDTYLAQAGKMEKQGVKFGFSFLDGKVKDFKKSTRRMIDKGLSEEAALAAVTTVPAAMMGVYKSYGTVEAGKMAHLVITDKPYFDEKSNVRYVFVDGHKYEYEVKSKKKKSKDEGGKPVAIAGKWNYEIEIPGMTRGGNFKITQNEDDVTVEMSSQDSPEDYLECKNVVLDGSNLSFGANVENQGMSLDLSFDLEIDGDSLEGSVNVGQFGSFPVNGSKVSDPE